MKSVTLRQDLEATAAEHPAFLPVLQHYRKDATFTPKWLARLIGAAAHAGFGRYRTLALLLKAHWESTGARSLRWSPWEDPGAFAHLLESSGSAAASSDIRLALLEQCALSCHLLGHDEVADLALRHERLRNLVTRAGDADRKVFEDDQCEWLRDELRLDDLLGVRQQLVAELESTRLEYLGIVGNAALAMAEAARQLAAMRLREAMNAPDLGDEDAGRLIGQALESDDPYRVVAEHEPELRQALLDTVEGLREDYQSVRHLARLQSFGEARPATDEERQAAARLFRRLARAIHPDALEQHPDYPIVSEENRERLREIWYRASATHGVRVHLSRERLVDYMRNLEDWLAEVEQIFRSMAFHAPSRLLHGATFEELRGDLCRARADVARHLLVVRDDITALEFDSRHELYRRVIAMNEDEREAERRRMRSLARAWEGEARTIASRIALHQAFVPKRASGGMP